MNSAKRAARRVVIGLGLGLLGLGIGVALLQTTTAYGQAGGGPDAALVESGKNIWKGRAACYNCHGWAGDGANEFNFPPGANLRETTLRAEDIVEVVSCGRPGTEMPYHLRTAYTEVPCYGKTKETLGTMTPPVGAALQSSQIEAVAAYIVARIKGRGPISKKECVEYFGPADAACAAYRD